LTTCCYYSVVFISAEEEIHRYHNVAQFKTTSQSSLHGPNNPSSLAVDDSLSTCARTDEERGASWTVDLGQTFIVSHLRINTGLFAESVGSRLLFSLFLACSSCGMLDCIGQHRRLQRAFEKLLCLICLVNISFHQFYCTWLVAVFSRLAGKGGRHFVHKISFIRSS